MKTLKRFLDPPAIVVSLAALFAFSPVLLQSCSPEQLQQADRVFADVNNAGQIAGHVASSPEGAMIPEPFRSALALLGFGGAAAFGIWQKIRASKILERSTDVTTALKAIVDAIDTVPAQAEPVKVEIKQIMKDREIYSTANAIVDELRSKKATA
jgi:hypothetical protein